MEEFSGDDKAKMAKAELDTWLREAISLGVEAIEINARREARGRRIWNREPALLMLKCWLFKPTVKRMGKASSRSADCSSLH